MVGIYNFQNYFLQLFVLTYAGFEVKYTIRLAKERKFPGKYQIWAALVN